MKTNTEKTYKDILKESYDNPNLFITQDQRYSLAASLLRTDEISSKTILKIAMILNRKPEDSYFITYGLLMQYNENLMNLEKENTELSIDEKANALLETCKILSQNANNKEFMDQIYNDVRLGTNIAKVYYPKQLQKDLLQLQNFTAMLNELKRSERF